jgi:glycosyltransferase involved in cell wall biosynthesis
MSNASSTTFVVSHLDPLLGLERAAWDLLLLLARRTSSLSLVALGGPVPPEHGQNLTIESLGSKVTSLRRIFAVRRGRRVLRQAKDRGVSQLVAVGAWAAIPLLMARLTMPNAPKVVVWEHSLSEEKVRTLPSLRVIDAVARLLYPTAASVICVNASLARRMSNRARAIQVIPNLVHVQRAEEPPGVERSGVITVGSLTRTKNHSTLLRAFRLLRTDEKLTIVGDGPERSRLERMARRLGLDSRVEFTGLLPSSEVRQRLRDARLMVHPALGETFGYVFYEACEAHLPVVATDAAVMNETIGEVIPGRLAAPTPESFAEAMRQELAATRHSAEWRVALKSIDEENGEVAISSAWLSALGVEDQ